MNWADVVYEAEVDDDRDVIELNELATAPAKLDDIGLQVKDPTMEVNLGLGKEHKTTYINAALDAGSLEAFQYVLRFVMAFRGLCSVTRVE